MLCCLQKTESFQQIAQFNPASFLMIHYEMTDGEGQFATSKLSDTLLAV